MSLTKERSPWQTEYVIALGFGRSPEHRAEFVQRVAYDEQHFASGFLALQRLIPLAFEQRDLRVGVGAGRLATPTDLWRTGALCLCRRASPVFHGIAACCGRAHSGHAAAATPRIPEYSRRFMIAPGSGDGIVSAQTNALEGALTAIVQLLSEARSMSQMGHEPPRRLLAAVTGLHPIPAAAVRQ